MDVAVTGSAGFVGRHLVRLLRGQGHHVTGLDRRGGDTTTPDVTGAASTVRCELSAMSVEARVALQSADAVVHLAGCPGVRDTRPDVGWRRYRDNVAAVREVLAAVPTGVPVLVASSSSVYGGSLAGRPSAEDDELAPRGGYARSKVLAEALCREAARHGARVTVVRPFTVVGEGQRTDMALHRWVAAALTGRPLTVLGSLDRTRDLTDVRDVVTALARLLDVAPGGVVNLGSGQPVPLRDMICAVENVIGAPVTLHRQPAAADEVPTTRADTRRLEALTGLRPVTDLIDVVSRIRDDIAQQLALPGQAAFVAAVAR